MRNPNFPQSTDLHEGVLQQRPPTAAVRRGEDGTQQRPAEPSAATAAHPTSSWSIAAAAPTDSAPAAARRAVASACGRRPVAAQATSGWSARRRPTAQETEDRVELEGAGGGGDSVGNGGNGPDTAGSEHWTGQYRAPNRLGYRFANLFVQPLTTD